MAPLSLLKFTLGAAALLAGFVLFRLSSTSPETNIAPKGPSRTSLPSSLANEAANGEQPHNSSQSANAPPLKRIPHEPEVQKQLNADGETHDDWTEHQLIAELRSLNFSQPELALELAREGKTRWKESEGAAEFSWFETRALVDLKRFEEAKDVGREMLESHPDSSFTADVRRHLFTHPFGESSRIR